MKAKSIIALVFGTLALGCLNAIAFIFDSTWINTSIALDSMVVGSIITYYFTNKNNA